MDNNAKLEAITAEFWSTISSQTIEKPTAIISPQVPPTYSKASTTVSSKKSKEQQSHFKPSEFTDLVEGNNHSNNGIIQETIAVKPAEQTLSDMIDETLLEGRKSYNSSNSQGSSNGRTRRRIDSIRTNDSEERDEKGGSGSGSGGSSARKKVNSTSKKWTAQERQTLLDLLSCFGTDFSTIQQYFQRKTISQIKNKFHKEEKQNPQLIRDILSAKGSENSKKQLMLNIDQQEVREHFEQKYHSNNRNNLSRQENLKSEQKSSNTEQQQQQLSQIHQGIEIEQPLNPLQQETELSISNTNPILKMVSDDIQRRLKDEGLSNISRLPG